MLKIKRSSAILLIFILIIMLSFGLYSCSAKRAEFNSGDGDFGFELPEEDWLILESQSIYEMNLVRKGNPGILVSIDCHVKNNLENLGVTDLDGFIKYCKTLSQIKEILEDENNSPEDLSDANKKDLKGGAALSGKRQKIMIENSAGSSTTEFVYLESEKYYFMLRYNAMVADFANAQKDVNDAIKHLKTE